jgi:ParB-like chromosome segregation protein Spo0J
MKAEVGETEHIQEVDIDRLKVNPVYYQRFPRPTKEEYEALKHSIDILGQTTPIEVNENFEVLDGYSRLSVLKDLRIPKAKVIVKKFNNKTEEFWYVYSKNAIRRDLNTWQKIVATLKTIEEVLKTQGIKTPLKDYLQKRGRKGNSEVTSEFRTKSIADQLGLSERTVEQALYIYFNGTQELHKRLERGQISIFQAYNRLKKQTQVQKPGAKKDLRDRIIVCPYCHKMFSIGDVNGS